MKTVSRNQIEELEVLREKIKLSTDTDAKIEMFEQVQKLLTSIDFMSSYSTNFSGDLLRYKSQKVITMQDALLDTLEEAIQQYKKS